MTIAAGVLGTLVGLVALVAIVGSLLPSAHVATRRARVAAAPDTVWSVVTDHSGEPSWRAGLRAVERVADRDGHAVWKEVDGHGQAMLLETVESDPPRRLVRRIVPTGRPFGGAWTIELAPEAGGTVVTVTENGEVTSPVFRFVSRFVVGHAATIEGYLRALGRRLGGDVAIS